MIPRWHVEVELVQWLASLGGRWWILDRLAIQLVSSLLLRSIPVVVILAGYWGAASAGERGRAARRVVIGGFLAAGLALVVSRGLQNFIETARPIHDAVLGPLFHGPFAGIITEDYHSFPSDHAAVLLPLLCAVATREWGVGAATGLLLFAALLARVYTGVHYPSDVLAGALIGSGAVWIECRLPEIGNRALHLVDLGRRRWPVAAAALLFLGAFLFATMFEPVRDIALALGRAVHIP
jgi:membrane-associated phospholipid phosphatase